MDSSTSNSEPPTPPHTWALRVLRAAWPTVLVTLVILGAAAAAVRRGATRNAPITDIEDVIVDGQLRRVATARGADVLIIGDSSALMDVDAAELGRLLG